MKRLLTFIYGLMYFGFAIYLGYLSTGEWYWFILILFTSIKGFNKLNKATE